MAMAFTTTDALKTIVVLPEGSDQVVTVPPEDREHFCLSVKDAVKGHQAVDDLMAFCFQMADLQNRLAEWIAEHLAKVHSAFLNFQDGHNVRFVVSQQEVRRDAQLSEDLIALDLEIARDLGFDQVNMDVLLLPRTSSEALSAFLSSGQVLNHAGNRGAQAGGSSESTNAGLSP